MISFKGIVAYEANTGALPVGARAGDLLLVHAVNDDPVIPSLPAGFESKRTDASGSLSSRVGFRVLQAGDADVGVWTNAVAVEAAIYRGVKTDAPLGDDGYALNAGGSGLVYVPDLALTVIDGTSLVVWMGVVDPGAGSGNNLYTRTHPTGRVFNRSAAMGVHYMGWGDSAIGSTDWTSVGNMQNDNGTFRKQFYSVELLAGEVNEPVRIVDDPDEENRYFTLDENNHWRLSDTDDGVTIFGRDITHTPPAHRIFTT